MRRGEDLEFLGAISRRFLHLPELAGRLRSPLFNLVGDGYGR